MSIDVTMNTKDGITLATSGKYCTDNISVSIPDSDKENITAENIKEGVSILGVVGAMTGESLTACPMPLYCTKIARGLIKITTAGTVVFVLKEGYRWTAGANNNYATGFFVRTDSTTSFSNIMQVSVGEDVKAGEKPVRFIRSYPQYVSTGDSTTEGAIAAVYGSVGNTFDFAIFICDKAQYTANPSAPPAIINISDICDVVGAELQ